MDKRESEKHIKLSKMEVELGRGLFFSLKFRPDIGVNSIKLHYTNS